MNIKKVDFFKIDFNCTRFIVLPAAADILKRASDLMQWQRIKFKLNCRTLPLILLKHSIKSNHGDTVVNDINVWFQQARIKTMMELFADLSVVQRLELQLLKILPERTCLVQQLNRQRPLIIIPVLKLQVTI